MLESNQHILVQRQTQLSVKGYETPMTHFHHKQIITSKFKKI